MIAELQRAGVDFVVLGGYAAIAHGATRITQDLDIAFSPAAENLEALGEVLIGLGATLRGIEEEVPFVPDGRTISRMSALTLDTEHGPLDLLTEPAGAPPYRELVRDSMTISMMGLEFRVASLDHLIAMKRAAGRNKDLLDLEELEVIQRLTDEAP